MRAARKATAVGMGFVLAAASFGLQHAIVGAEVPPADPLPRVCGLMRPELLASLLPGGAEPDELWGEKSDRRWAACIAGSREVAGAKLSVQVTRFGRGEHGGPADQAKHAHGGFLAADRDIPVSGLGDAVRCWMDHDFTEAYLMVWSGTYVLYLHYKNPQARGKQLVEGVLLTGQEVLAAL
ncbi:hypothetical protein Cs7R123_24450 [Catellatospora sp. TT07R-123]|nr:hypothetical protein Cs7R123_24450 [Catellatospora sp. TT07R-123]